MHVELKCHRCGNVWTYRGNNEYRTLCSHCATTVYLKLGMKRAAEEQMIKKDGETNEL